MTRLSRNDGLAGLAEDARFVCNDVIRFVHSLALLAYEKGQRVFPGAEYRKLKIAFLAFSFILFVGAKTKAQEALYDVQTGIVSLDSMGLDLVAIYIEGPDVSVFGCNLCDGNNMPGIDAEVNSSTWSVSYNDGATEWLRTDPQTGLGFRGSIGEFFIDGNDDLQSWPVDFPPFLDFPEGGLGIATYPAGLSPSDFGDVTYVAENGDTVVEPLCVTLVCGNRTPVAADDSYEAIFSSVLDVAAPGVLDNDFDPDGDPFVAGLSEAPMLGSVMLNSDGSFAYTAPALGSVPAGTIDSFDYIVFDDVLASFDTGTVNITLRVPEPHLPIYCFWIVLFAAGYRR